MKFEICCVSGAKPSFENITTETEYNPQCISKRLVHNLPGIAYAYREKDWFGEGRKHREEDGVLWRECPKTIYFCEVSTLEQLLEMAKEEDLIIYNNAPGMPSLQVYDDYLE